MITIREYRQHPRTHSAIDFSKMKKGWDSIEDSVLELDKFKRTQLGSTYANKDNIMRALETQDVLFLRNLSIYYMGISGIYQRIVEYVSSILTYDWFAYPYIVDKKPKIKDTEYKDFDTW